MYLNILQMYQGEGTAPRLPLSTQSIFIYTQYTYICSRYHNLMGNETIQVLELMTSGIRAVVTHPTMTDRLAAMLNYFLKTLTGPDRKSFKVRGGELGRGR